MKPTVGRVVHFHPTAGVTHAAIIAYVHSDTMVNLAVFDDNGKAYGQPSVQLVAPGTPKPEFGFYCDWMSYQVEQAKKNEDEAVNAVASSPAGVPRITPEHAIVVATVLALVFVAGFIKAHSEITQECERLGAFYVGEKTFACELKKSVKTKEATQ